MVDLVRELYLGRLKMPEDYSDDTAEAVVLFCGRFLQLLLWQPALRTCRLSIAEAERHPEASAQYYDAIFTVTHARLAAFLGERCRLAPAMSADSRTSSSAARSTRSSSAPSSASRSRCRSPTRQRSPQDIDLAPIRTGRGGARA